VQPFGGGTHAAVQRNLHEHLELARTDVDHRPILSARLIGSITYFKFS
jgi:hypothetical protein